MATHQLKQNDTAPLALQLRDRNGPVDLTVGIDTVTFRMEAQNLDNYVEIEAEIDVDDGDSGWINVPFGAGDLDTPGLYRAEVSVLKLDGKIQTFPTEGEPPYLMIKVNAIVVADA